jgi:DNA polymerase III alpha subunit
MEDEHGPINVIVRPDVYKRDRNAVRMETFLAVSGQLQKDGTTINVIANDIRALRVPGAPIHQQELQKISSPDNMEYPTKLKRTSTGPFRYLTALRQSPPGIKSFT